MDRERILDKIKKCLALSQSPEPAEAAAALRQAQKLMEAHNISEGELARTELGEAQVRSAVSVSRIKDWELGLLNLVAKAFGCRLLWLRSSSYASGEAIYGRYTLIGIKHQVELAQYTATVLQRKLVKARAQFVDRLPASYGRGRKTLEADGFCHGWVATIAATVHAFAMPEATMKLIDACVVERSNGRRSKVQRREAGAAGYQAGQLAARNESLHRPMNERQPVVRLAA